MYSEVKLCHNFNPSRFTACCNSSIQLDCTAVTVPLELPVYTLIHIVITCIYTYGVYPLSRPIRSAAILQVELKQSTVEDDEV